MHPSHLKRKGSLCLFGFCLLVSSVPNFCPDTGRRRWSLVQVASSIALRGGRSAAFPVYAAQAPGCSMWNLPCAARGSSPPVLHKSADSAPPVFCAFPDPSNSGSQELDGHTLPRCSAPSPLRIPIPARAVRVPSPCVSPRPSRRVLTIQNLRRSLIRNRRPVCSAVGDAVLGAEPAPVPSPLPPASGGAGPVRSRLALPWTCSGPLFCERLAVCSGRLIFSLFCCPTV